MPASVVVALWSTSVGKKAVMAVTGLILTGFVIAHLLGNLKVFQGEEKFNAYAVWLRAAGSPAFGHEQLLWLGRLVLLTATVLHIGAAVQLAQMSYAARPVRYARREPIQSTYASRTMRWGGAIITLFVIYHLLHFTFGAVGYAPGQYRPMSVYRNVVIGVSVWYVSLHCREGDASRPPPAGAARALPPSAQHGGRDGPGEVRELHEHG